MSITTCRCGCFIDTDQDDDCFSVGLLDGSTVKLQYALCFRCRVIFAELVQLKEKVDVFTDSVYDLIRPLKQEMFLHNLYQFSAAIDSMTNPEKK